VLAALVAAPFKGVTALAGWLSTREREGAVVFALLALIMAAAVADFRPAKTAAGKIRREETPSLRLELEPIPDLIATLGGEKDAAGVFRVGFAAEDSDLAAKAVEKMKRKGLQGIVANDISRKDIGFGSDNNAGIVFFADGSRQELEKMTKREMADRILDLVVPRLPKP